MMADSQSEHESVDGKDKDDLKFEHYLSETLGLTRVKKKGKTFFEPWTCLSCLLSVVYNIYSDSEDGD